MTDREDELICPITYERFRDPVTAEDNRVYERAAIVQWIVQHGTSPFTRQVLRIDRLVSNERIKNLADQQRKSSVSYINNGDGQAVLPSLTSASTNRPVTVVFPVNNLVVVNDRFHCLRCIRCSRIYECASNTCSSIGECLNDTGSWCCSPTGRPYLCVIVFLIICVFGIFSFLIYTLVTNHSNKS